MSYGLEIRNEASKVIIDGDYKNLAIKENGLSPRVIMDVYVAEITNFGFNSASPPILMIRPPVGYLVGAYPLMDSGAPLNSATIEIHPAMANLEYLILRDDIASISDANTHGLIVYNQAGVKVFSTAQQNFQIDAALTISNSGSSGPFNFTLPTPEFGRRFVQAVFRNAIGGGGGGIMLRLNSETSLTVYCYFFDPYLAGLQNVTILTGFTNL